MLCEREIDEKIAELEKMKDHSPYVCSYLASLYAIKDHAFEEAEPVAAYSLAPAPVMQAPVLDTYGDSEFLLVVAGKVPEDAWAVMDELMDTIRVAYPRAYETVMRKLRKLDD